MRHRRPLKPLIFPTPAQLALLLDASKASLSRFGRFWRRNPRATAHLSGTAESLFKRRLLAYENDRLFITPRGRSFLAAHAEAAAHAA